VLLSNVLTAREAATVESTVYFAQDPKNVLSWIKETYGINDWSPFFGLIREAHAAAHPANDEKPDFAYLQRFMADALHQIEPRRAILSKLKVS